MDNANIERISKALANETRLLIFEAIAGNKEMNSSAIVTLRGVAAATVSHHLKILSHAGLIECRRQGQFVHHRAVPETIENYAWELSRLSRPKKRSRRRRRVNAQPAT
jgi:DNA-binding transcriptional ArsR family regulator